MRERAVAGLLDDVIRPLLFGQESNKRYDFSEGSMPNRPKLSQEAFVTPPQQRCCMIPECGALVRADRVCRHDILRVIRPSKIWLRMKGNSRETSTEPEGCSSAE
jgi:hypothetical protein